MRFLKVILSALATAAVVVARPSNAITARSIEPVKYLPILKANGRISATSGSPNGLYMVHNDTHAAYYGEVSDEQLTLSQ